LTLILVRIGIDKGWRISAIIAIGSTIGSVVFAPVDCSSSLRRMQ